MTKNEFLQQLDIIADDTLFIGHSRADLQKEIENNMWCISVDSELAKEITVEDLSAFLEKVILNRKGQIEKLKPPNNMIFYMWFDEQAVQLRLNIISDYDTGLPFGCKVVPVINYSHVIETFLKSPFHDGIPIEELHMESGEANDQKASLEIYCEVYCIELSCRH